MELHSASHFEIHLDFVYSSLHDRLQVENLSGEPLNVKHITSCHNPLIQSVAALHRKSERRHTHLILVEGLHPVHLALQSSLPVKSIFFLDKQLEKKSHQMLLSQSESLDRFVVSQPVMKKLSTTHSSCPVVAVVEHLPQTLDQLKMHSNGFYLITHRTSDPGNLGTLIRVAVATGVDALILIGDTCDPTNPKVVRASQGALFYLPIISVTEFEPMKLKLQEKAIRLIAADPQATREFTQEDYTSGIAFILGEESEGLPPNILKQSDDKIRIPTLPPMESLNVAVSGAILLYEARNQRKS